MLRQKHLQFMISKNSIDLPNNFLKREEIFHACQVNVSIKILIKPLYDDGF